MTSRLDKLKGLALIAALAAGTMAASVPLAGCTQQQVQKTVTVIETELPVVLQDAADVMAILAPFGLTAGSNPIAALQLKAQDLNSILADYKAGKNTWADVLAAVNALAAASDQAVDLAGVKNPASQQKAQAILAAISLAVNLIYGAAQTTQTPAQVKANTLSRHVRLAQVARNWTDGQKAEFALTLGARDWQAASALAEAHGF